MIKLDGTMCPGSSASKHVRIIESAMKVLRRSPTTGIKPMTADQPYLNPQQQHDNERSALGPVSRGSYPFGMHVFELS
jgi:hypothetical protein